MGATNVYHMSLYIAHGQSKPVGSRAKTSFLIMKEFNAESCSFISLFYRSGITLVFVALSVWVSRIPGPLVSLELTHDA